MLTFRILIDGKKIEGFVSGATKEQALEFARLSYVKLNSILDEDSQFDVERIDVAPAETFH